MEDAKFNVALDDAARMLRIRVHGFWDEATMDAYVEAVRKAMAALQKLSGDHYALVDMSGYPIQSGEIAEAHGALLRASAKVPGLRVALVMQSALSRLQANRLATDTGYEIFDSAQEALAWLRDGGSAPAT